MRDANSLLQPMLSPDGRRVAAFRTVQGDVDLWVFDAGRETRLTSDPGRDQFPVWSPDGRRIAFSKDLKGQLGLYQKSSLGGGAEELLLAPSGNARAAQAWSPDGRFLMYQEGNNPTRQMAGGSRTRRMNRADLRSPCDRFPPRAVNTCCRQRAGSRRDGGGAAKSCTTSRRTKRIAVGSDDGKEAIVWIADLSGTTAIRRLTLAGRNRVPVWSAGGDHVAFQSDREGDLAIWWQRADGTTPAERLTKPDDKDTTHVPESWSPDGRTLLFSVAKGSGYLLAALSLPAKKVTLFGGVESTIPPAAAFSPDGKWVAYSVGRPGGSSGSLFVQPFPATGATYPMWKGTGIHATWSPDGKELFYSQLIGQLVTVSVTTRPAFTFGNPVVLTRVFADRGPAFERNNDITRDGKHFLGVVAAGQSSTAPQIQVVLNWFEELRVVSVNWWKSVKVSSPAKKIS